ncbi:outer membrane beta-barrel protein [Flavobacterium lacus]|uniref:Outer membrane protein W n=1 Tax=Flavobacterium lacus TaxID=1353778 RepID=A0A328X6P4_9FLAO|nr:outer membrane beta-barrel protein [Flavobacterium lacus]RAR51029.1 outer membrane protein W [Flavobacterium lacus]
MKKIILTVAAVFAISFVNAQEGSDNQGFAKGDLYMSGSVGINSTKMGDIKSDGYTFSPGVGYFVTENIALEGSISLTKQTVGVEVEGETFDIESTGLAFAVGGKYFFTPADKFSFFAGLGVGYGVNEIGEGEETVDLKTFSVALAPGVNYFFNSHFAAQASIGVLGYSSSKFDFEGAEAMNTFNLSLDLTNVNFSLIYKF